MSSPVHWLADGSAYSPQYGDRYHAAAGYPLAQAREVFLAGCGLPAAWRGARHWRVLENGFGFGVNFLATWDAWRKDPAAPRLLHYVGIEAHPLPRNDLQALYDRLIEVEPALAALCHELLANWWGLTPGMHRILLAEGRLHLTLVIGEADSVLADLAGQYDSLYLDGFAPDRNPVMWSRGVLRALARRAAPGARAASWCVAGKVRRHLSEAGFQVERMPGLPPKRHRLSARYAPAWTVRQRANDPSSLAAGASLEGLDIAVIGAGLAGAATADSLARRGARLTLFDAADQPAAGASSLPAGLMAAHFSRDDGLMTQLTRAGIRLTMARAQSLLVSGEDYAFLGCEQALDPGAAETQALTEQQKDWMRFVPERNGVWHRRAGWIKPARLVAALLHAAQARFIGNCTITRVESCHDGRKQALLDRNGEIVFLADRVVIAAGPASAQLLPVSMNLRPVAGQVAWGYWPETLAQPQASYPQNGFGHWLPWIPEARAQARWLLGSTYEPGRVTHPEPFVRMLEIARQTPSIAAAIEAAEDRGELHVWSGVRATTNNRLPRVGVLPGQAPDQPGLAYLTGLGSRGLSLALLCAEHLAALMAGEPPPIPFSLVQRCRAQPKLEYTQHSQHVAASSR